MYFIKDYNHCEVNDFLLSPSSNASNNALLMTLTLIGIFYMGFIFSSQIVDAFNKFKEKKGDKVLMSTTPLSSPNPAITD
uniref:Uncharacterized protein n=1 Tax=Glossina palpalis gambiensis TaxID=67801 RepID=A0A1B0ANY9_9MUSC